MTLRAIVLGMADAALFAVESGDIFVSHQKIGCVINGTQVERTCVTTAAFQTGLLIVMARRTILHRRHAFGIGIIDVIQIGVAGLALHVGFFHVELVVKHDVSRRIGKKLPGILIFIVTQGAVFFRFHIVAHGTFFFGYEQIVAR